MAKITSAEGELEIHIDNELTVLKNVRRSRTAFVIDHTKRSSELLAEITFGDWLELDARLAKMGLSIGDSFDQVFPYDATDRTYADCDHFELVMDEDAEAKSAEAYRFVEVSV